MPNVKFKHPQLKAMERSYEKVEDCLAGETQVKYRKTRYLPKPNPADQTRENAARYDSYVERAVFYNVTGRTQDGLVGAVFETDPVTEVPEKLKPVLENTTGTGINIDQMARDVVGKCLSLGRLGLFVDYPDTEGGVSRANLSTVNPYIKVYGPLDIINWRTDTVDGVNKLVLVVLHEKYIVSDDGFEQQMKDQWRVLRLVNNVYRQELWRDNIERPFATFQPTTASGATIDTLPFTFCGSENNDPDVDKPPMFDLASLNIAHYRNSADYEEMVFIVGQPTPWFSGLTEAWVTDIFKGPVLLGSRAAIPLPVDGEAGLLQVEANTAAFEAMEHKERQMVALGARLVQQADTQRTATEARMEDATETSVLANVAKNSSAAIQTALRWCSLYIDGVLPTEKEVVYKLNTEFSLAHLSPEELTQVLTAWQSDAITTDEMRARLRAGKLATLSDADFATKVVEQQAARDKRAAQQADDLAKAAANHAPARPAA